MTAKLAALILTLGLSVLPASTHAQLVVPSNAQSSFGNTYADPLFRPDVAVVYQVYGASEFANAGSDVISITGVAFRLDPAESGSLDVVVPRVVITAGSFPGSLAAVTRAAVQKLDYQTVLYRQNVHLAGKPTTPNNFSVKFTFDTPYLYDRRNGQLVLAFDSLLTGGNIQALDAQRSADGVFVRSVPDPLLMVTQFTYTTVPEPAAVVICVLGLTCFRARKRFQPRN